LERLNERERVYAERLKELGCLPPKSDPVWQLATSEQPIADERLHALSRLTAEAITGMVHPFDTPGWDDQS
jgi:hypothetical protein